MNLWVKAVKLPGNLACVCVCVYESGGDGETAQAFLRWAGRP